MVGVPNQRLRPNRESCTPPNKGVKVDPMPRRLHSLHWSAKRLIRIFERIRLDRGLPYVMRTDNGPEFTSSEFVVWA